MSPYRLMPQEFAGEESAVGIDRQALEQLQEVVGGSPEDLREMIESFLEEAPEICRALEAAHANADLTVTRRSAHSLKSNARDMGAFDLSDLCAAVEKDSSAGTLPTSADILRIQALLDAAMDELRHVAGIGA